MLLTGASGGLGAVMALAFADLKVRQILAAFPGSGLDDLQKAVVKRGGEAIAITCDVRDAEQRKQLLLDTKRQFGPVDILVNLFLDFLVLSDNVNHLDFHENLALSNVRSATS